MRRQPSYWIRFEEWYCVICTLTETYRVRVYDRPKPKRWHERHNIHETVCVGHYL